MRFWWLHFCPRRGTVPEESSPGLGFHSGGSVRPKQREKSDQIQPKTSNFLTERISTPEPAVVAPTSVQMCLGCGVHLVHGSQRHPGVSVMNGIDSRRFSDRQTYQNVQWIYGDALLLGRSLSAGARILVGGPNVT